MAMLAISEGYMSVGNGIYRTSLLTSGAYSKILYNQDHLPIHLTGSLSNLKQKNYE